MEAGPDGRRVHHTNEYVLLCEQVRQLPICHAAIDTITKAYMRKIILRISEQVCSSPALFSDRFSLGTCIRER
jgi:hypothetical protein